MATASASDDVVGRRRRRQAEQPGHHAGDLVLAGAAVGAHRALDLLGGVGARRHAPLAGRQQHHARAPGRRRTRCGRWRRSTAPRWPSPRGGARPAALRPAGGCRPAAAPAARRRGSGSRPPRRRAAASRRRARRRSRCWRCRDRCRGRACDRHSPRAPGRLPAPGRHGAVRSLSTGPRAAQPAAASAVLADVILSARSTLCTGAWRRALVVLCLSALASRPRRRARRAPPGRAARRLAPNDAVIDGPSADIRSLNGMSMARDGTGALVYLKDDPGRPARVRLAPGRRRVPGPACRSTPASLGASSQPVIASGPGGLLLVAFINGGTLYVAQAADARPRRWARPAALFSGAVNPSISISNFGKALPGLHRHRGRRRRRRAGPPTTSRASGRWSPPRWTPTPPTPPAPAPAART